MTYDDLFTIGGPLILAAVVQLSLLRSRRSPAALPNATGAERWGGRIIDHLGALLAAMVLLTAGVMSWAFFAAVLGEEGVDASAPLPLAFFGATSLALLVLSIALQAVSAAVSWSQRDVG